MAVFEGYGCAAGGDDFDVGVLADSLRQVSKLLYEKGVGGPTKRYCLRLSSFSGSEKSMPTRPTVLGLLSRLNDRPDTANGAPPRPL